MKDTPDGLFGPDGCPLTVSQEAENRRFAGMEPRKPGEPWLVNPSHGEMGLRYSRSQMEAMTREELDTAAAEMEARAKRCYDEADALEAYVKSRKRQHLKVV